MARVSLHEKDRLREQIRTFCTEIDRQAREIVLPSWIKANEGSIADALMKIGVSDRPVFRFLRIWEDHNGQLPPKLLCEAVVTAGDQRMLTQFDVAVGPLHVRGKADHIFEMCMLRAEARMEIEDRCDGEVLQRMMGLRGELGF
jgi:hypothetical protein